MRTSRTNTGGGRRAVLAALTLMATTLAPLPAAYGLAREAACTWRAALLPVPADLNGGAEITAADSAGGYAGDGEFMMPWGGSSTTALRWKDGKVTEFTAPTDLYDPTVTGVNRDGTVVGDGNDLGDSHAFRSRGGTLERLPEPAGAYQSWATGINDNGDIVGHVGRKTTQGGVTYPVYQAVIWPASAPGTVVPLSGGLPATGQTQAAGIDQDGTVAVAYTTKATDWFKATALYLWRNGGARKPALPSGTAGFEATGIAGGRVAGVTYTSATSEEQGVLWDQNGTPLRPTNSLHVNSVNRSGQSVGRTKGGYGVWQLGQQVTTMPGTLALTVSADDGAVAGWSRPDPGGDNLPTVWRCG
ncbi:hypothetical protein [Streptomyces sp. NPDC001843]|uniref:hypothetical protein n=1 Tax=Streptomyces sp. NPDC001843 TaxID=3364617 RepID=UPI0036A570FE